MALDHVRMYLSNAQFSPSNPDATNLALFLTRWITHFCAPGFFFVAGIGVSLYLAKSGNKFKVVQYLLSRGLWLIFLELTIIGFAWSFNPGWSFFGVMWALGWAFLITAGAIYLPRLLLLVVSISIAFFHPVIFGDNLSSIISNSSLASVLYDGGPATLPLLGEKGTVYTVLPWASIMTLGFALGPLFSAPSIVRMKRLALLGASFTMVFLVFRVTNIYGNPQDISGGWSGLFSMGPDLAQTMINLLNTNKYPPSPQFTLMTLGPLLLLLAWWARFDGIKAVPTWLKPIQIIGRVPFFFYVTHIFLIHLAALAAATLFNQPKSLLFWDGNYPSLTPPDGYGFSLLVVYVVWAAVVAALYFPSKWFEEVKRKNNAWWLRYL